MARYDGTEARHCELDTLGQGWEERGVVPDIIVSSKNALQKVLERIDD